MQNTLDKVKNIVRRFSPNRSRSLSTPTVDNPLTVPLLSMSNNNTSGGTLSSTSSGAITTTTVNSTFSQSQTGYTAPALMPHNVDPFIHFANTLPSNQFLPPMNTSSAAQTGTSPHLMSQTSPSTTPASNTAQLFAPSTTAYTPSHTQAAYDALFAGVSYQSPHQRYDQSAAALSSPNRQLFDDDDQYGQSAAHPGSRRYVPPPPGRQSFGINTSNIPQQNTPFFTPGGDTRSSIGTGNLSVISERSNNGRTPNTPPTALRPGTQQQEQQHSKSPPPPQPAPIQPSATYDQQMRTLSQQQQGAGPIGNISLEQATQFNNNMSRIANAIHNQVAQTNQINTVLTQQSSILSELSTGVKTSNELLLQLVSGGITTATAAPSQAAVRRTTNLPSRAAHKKSYANKQLFAVRTAERRLRTYIRKLSGCINTISDYMSVLSRYRQKSLKY